MYKQCTEFGIKFPAPRRKLSFVFIRIYVTRTHNNISHFTVAAQIKLHKIILTENSTFIYVIIVIGQKKQESQCVKSRDLNRHFFIKTSLMYSNKTHKTLKFLKRIPKHRIQIPINPLSSHRQTKNGTIH